MAPRSNAYRPVNRFRRFPADRRWLHRRRFWLAARRRAAHVYTLDILLEITFANVLDADSHWLIVILLGQIRILTILAWRDDRNTRHSLFLKQWMQRQV